MTKPENIKYGRYWALLDIWMGLIAAGMPLKEPYAQKLLVTKTGGWFLINEKDLSPQTGYSVFEHRRGKNPGYFGIVNRLGKCSIWFLLVIQHYVFNSDEAKTKLCKLIKLKEVILTRKCMFLGDENVQHAGAGRNRNHGLGCHLYFTWKTWTRGTPRRFPIRI